MNYFHCSNIIRTHLSKKIYYYRVNLRKCFYATDHQKFYGEVALITGGTRGIGFELAKKFATGGANCIVVGKNSERVNVAVLNLMKLEREKKNNADNNKKGEIGHDHDNRHIGIVCDLSSGIEIEKAAKAFKHFGRVDYLINAAGISHDSLLIQVKDSEIDEIISTNLVGAILVSRNVAKIMLRQNKGCIINISSVIGLYGNSGQSIYSASKAGIIGFSKSLAKELARKNIRVNVIAPGYIDTEMTSGLPSKTKDEILSKTLLNRIGDVKDVAHAAMYLATANFVTGQTLIVDGGLSIS
ncbi:11754_t:CDS:2 [Ambispora gerdemannii]|uniref:11754_t:CDS:1 n=1 Tax=Ambispora gerdemannii TaxID=144530 RepID=A0A9N8YIT8_9GLOM|nr:11754_t:CDS:2 [Ambispora gerdemannii]